MNPNKRRGQTRSPMEAEVHRVLRIPLVSFPPLSSGCLQPLHSFQLTVASFPTKTLLDQDSVYDVATRYPTPPRSRLRVEINDFCFIAAFNVMSQRGVRGNAQEEEAWFSENSLWRPRSADFFTGLDIFTEASAGNYSK